MCAGGAGTERNLPEKIPPMPAYALTKEGRPSGARQGLAHSPVRTCWLLASRLTACHMPVKRTRPPGAVDAARALGAQLLAEGQRAPLVAHQDGDQKVIGQAW